MKTKITLDNNKYMNILKLGSVGINQHNARLILVTLQQNEYNRRINIANNKMQSI